MKRNEMNIKEGKCRIHIIKRRDKAKPSNQDDYRGWEGKDFLRYQIMKNYKKLQNPGANFCTLIFDLENPVA